MTDKQIIYNCPHISFTDWGTYACKLYDPRDKNCLVKGGNCDSNISCPYKQHKRAENQIVELNKMVEAKEQECKALREEKAYTDMACEQFEQQLDQLKAELEAYKMEAEEGKEINAELKAENKHLNDLLNQALKENEELQQLKDEDSLRVTRLAMENTLLQKKFEESEYARGNELIKLVGSKTQIEAYKQVIKKVRELCQKDKDFCVSCEGDGNIDCIDCTEGGKAKLAVQILRICDEVNYV